MNPIVCPVNVSEGRPGVLLAALIGSAGDDLLDVHADPHHHRSVLTLVGEAAPRRVAATAVERLDLAGHVGAHPRLGVIDVVPFVADQREPARAPAAREAFLAWIGDELGVPAFRYGPGGGGDDVPTLPEVRRRAFVDLAPAAGPPAPHPSAGAVCVGARPPLVAYNLWLAEPDLARARAVASEVRSPAIRALGLTVGPRVQVSLNLVRPDEVGPDRAFDLVAERVPVAGAELVGLLPAAVLESVPRRRWAQLDLSADRTVEWRLAHARRRP